MYQMVVSKQQADIGWVGDEPASLFDVLVYEESSPGAEAEDWLTHIQDRWQDLPEYTIFLQGSTTTHMGGLREVLGNFPTSAAGLEGTPGCRFLCDRVTFENHDDSVAWDGSSWARIKPLDLFGELFRGPPPGNFAYSPGGQYAVHRSNIVNKPVGFYRRALEAIRGDRTGRAKMDRLWPMVFDGEDRWLCRA